MIRDFLRRQVAVFGRARRRRTPRLRLVVPRLGLPQDVHRPHLPSLRRQRPMEVVYEKAIVHETYSLRARVLQRAARLVLKPLLELAPVNDSTLRITRGLNRLSARQPRSRHVEPYRYELGGVPVESLNHRFGPESDMTILYFHGGAFLSCGIETHRRACERLAYHTGATVISVDYVQLPEGTVAESVQDAINAYAALLDEVAHPDKIVLAGDSAGGYLSLKVAELATRRGLRAPAAILGFSPLLSLDPDRLDKAVEQVGRINDAYLPRRKMALVRERWLPEGAAIEGYASPLHASAYITSPVFMVAAEDEILRPEVEAMAVLLSSKGVEVETHLWRKQVHAFPVIVDVLPESKRAIELAAQFASIAVGERDKPVDVSADDSVEPLIGEIVTEEVDAPEDEILEGLVIGDPADADRSWRRHFRAS